MYNLDIKGVDYMDIAMLAMNMSQINLQNQVSIAVADKAMDTQKIQNQDVLQMLTKSSVTPSFGHTLDTYA